jgi:lipopolysaccharide export system protein LptC
MADDSFPPDELVRQRRRQVRRYTRFVSVMKYLLPILAAGLVVMLGLWSQIRIDEGRFRIGMTEVAPVEVDKLTMSNPRFEGIDDRNRPFTVTADEASQIKDNADAVELTRPQADMTMADGTWVALNADKGHYRRAEQLLSLEGSVSLFQDRGYELHTDRVVIDFKTGTAVSEMPVFGQGPVGELSGDGLKLSDKGAVIELTGDAHLVFHPNRQDLVE